MKYYSSHNSPNAFISIRRNSTNNRLKIYENSKIFLEKNCEFEIEFENYTKDIYLAKIRLNGNFISDTGLILKPGQHIYLDRYLDIDKKFKFDVYEIENTQEAKNAVQNNGWVEIYFYKEIQSNKPSWNYSTSASGYNNFNNIFYRSSARPQSNEVYDVYSLTSAVNVNDTIETGRIEQGSKSNQTFKYENREFEDSYTHSVLYNLLPLSQLVNSNVREYCTSCGYRLRDNKWTYCPKCGNKI